jgi:hypothetical protein
MTSIKDFDFEFNGYGRYRVTYMSPKTYKKWTSVITDMRLIDDTKNEGAFAKRKDLNNLKLLIKTHNEKI